MQKILICLFALLTLLSSCASESPKRDYSEVNPVIGDLSSRLGQGILSPENQSEQQRVATHLAFAEYLIRSRDDSHLSPKLRERRTQLLDLLHEYRTAGVFPANFDHPGQRRPCFIDQRGNICAVGYLVEKTAGLAAAEAINHRYQYADIAEMDAPSLDQWIAESGLSRDEVAMIQPTYNYYPPTNPADVISPARSVFSALTGGIGTGCSVLSLANLNNSSYGKALPAIGLGTGAAQLLMGVAPLVVDGRNAYSYNYRRQTLSTINIGVGVTNVLINGYALVRKRPARPKAAQLSLFGAPVSDKRMAWGVGLTKAF